MRIGSAIAATRAAALGAVALLVSACNRDEAAIYLREHGYTTFQFYAGVIPCGKFSAGNGYLYGIYFVGHKGGEEHAGHLCWDLFNRTWIVFPHMTPAGATEVPE